MNPHSPAGLVASGSVIQSPFARLPALLDRLGPVKSGSLRLASRVSNGLGAGHPVSHYADLADAPVVVVIAPDEEVPKLALELAGSGIDWKGKTAMLAGTWLGSSSLAPLAARGAETVTLCHAESPAEERCLVEGSRAGVNEAKRLLLDSGFRVIVVEPEDKPLVLAALTFAEALIFPLMAAAEECLRAAHVPSLEAGGIVQRAVARGARAYGKSRRKAWDGPLARRNAPLMRNQLEAAERADPRTALLLSQSARQALEYFGADTKWFPAPPAK